MRQRKESSMIDPSFDCASCKNKKPDLYFDKRYKQSICGDCFLKRRKAAAAALDSEWFLANIPFDQFTEEEKKMTGIGSLVEFKLAKERAVPDGTEDGESTRELRGR
jgi:hypothetical protein